MPVLRGFKSPRWVYLGNMEEIFACFIWYVHASSDHVSEYIHTYASERIHIFCLYLAFGDAVVQTHHIHVVIKKNYIL